MDNSSENNEESLTFHRFNENILFSTLASSTSYSAAYTQHLTFLKQTFPHRSSEIEKLQGKVVFQNFSKNLPELLKAGMKLVLFHQSCLQEKGKK